MVADKCGRILQISSVWGNVGASCEVAYSACKGGINAFTKALGKELAPSHIPVNAIACGVIDTDMNRCFDETERAELADEIPAGRFATACEVADMAYSVITAPDYLTGQIITLMVAGFKIVILSFLIFSYFFRYLLLSTIIVLQFVYE